MIRSFSIRAMLVLLCLCALVAVPVLSHADSTPSYTVEIADVGKSKDFAQLLQKKGYTTSVPAKNMWVTDLQSNCAVWIGKNIPLDMLRTVLPEAYNFNPELQFFHLVGDRGEQPPAKVDNTLHIGGHIEAAMVKKLNTLSKDEVLAALGKSANIEEFHKWLHEKNVPKPDAEGKGATGTKPAPASPAGH